MKIQLVSDTHFEMHRDGGRSFIASLDPTDVDVLILAGDILYLQDYAVASRTLADLEAKYPKIIYVIGNHEGYTSSIDQVLATANHFQNRTTGQMLVVTEPCTIKFSEGGQRFLCAPMYYPFSVDDVFYSDQMNDARLVKGWTPYVNVQYDKTRKWFAEHMQPGDVVVTHYLPSYQCIAPQYKGSVLNRFFVGPMEDLIAEKRPKLWMFGHTHQSMDRMIGETRCVSNPLGYPKEPTRFDQKLVIEV